MKQTKRERYEALLHAMQSGVAMIQNYDPQPTQPKHLRVGINAAMSDQGGLAKLLIDKGLITEDEYLDSLIWSMENEVKLYQTRLEQLTGAKIRLV